MSTGGQEGKEEEEREEVLVHSERQTPQGCRLEPAVKAQGVWHKLAGVVTREGGPFSHHFKGKRRKQLENCWQGPRTRATHSTTTHTYHALCRNGPIRKTDTNKHMQGVSGFLPQLLWQK